MEEQIDALTNVLKTCARALNKIGQAGAEIPELLDTASAHVGEAVLTLQQRKTRLTFDGYSQDGHGTG